MFEATFRRRLAVRATCLEGDGPRGLLRFILAAVVGLLFLFLGAQRVEGASAAGDLEPRIGKPGAWPDAVGPRASAIGKDTDVQVSDEGRTVTYRWGERHELVFRLIEPPAGRPVFLSTTEVSVGLFIDLLRALEKTREFAALMPRGGGFDVRKGPRTWRWVSHGRNVGFIASWLMPLPNVVPYPDGLRPARPSRSHPVQYVSAEAAAALAVLLGCRLPTPAEWGAAWRAAGECKRNLRDATWLRQRDHMRGVFARGVAGDWPDAGIFVPPGVKVARGGDATAVTEADDGTLWFSPVGSGTGFKHLAGNVAEFVFEKPQLLEKARSSGPAQVAALVKRNRDAVRVIGGSALSPPELWDGRARPFVTAWPVGDTSEGYSDVGFRLAFTAPGTMTKPERLAHR